MNDVTTDYYLNILLSLMPKGKAWGLSNDGVMYGILKTAATTFRDLHNQANRLLVELNPGQTTLLIDEFEELLNLPEKCNSHPKENNNFSLGQRRLNVLNKYLNNSLNTKEYIIEYAKKLGYDIEIEELRVARFGEPMSTFSNGGEANTIKIIVNNINKVGAVFGDFFGQEFGLREQNNHVECVLDKVIPAHIQVIYIYK